MAALGRGPLELDALDLEPAGRVRRAPRRRPGARSTPRAARLARAVARRRAERLDGEDDAGAVAGRAPSWLGARRRAAWSASALDGRGGARARRRARAPPARGRATASARTSPGSPGRETRRSRELDAALAGLGLAGMVLTGRARPTAARRRRAAAPSPRASAPALDPDGRFPEA